MNDFLVAGIDPGINGAIAILNSNWQMVDMIDFPGDTLLVGGLLDELRTKYTQIAVVGLEHVHANSLNGCKGNFSLGGNYGVWRAMLHDRGIDTRLYSPQAWQKEALTKSEGKNTKERSLSAARRMFPDAAGKLKRQKDDGRADALHIAAFTLKQWVKERGKA
jgi:hypothetical protein